jgi:hypothetical protein
MGVNAAYWRGFAILLAGAVLFTRFPIALNAQSPESSKLTLGSTSGTPGAAVVVPIYFSPAQGIAVGELELVISYVSVNLDFSKVEPGIAAELGKVDLTTQVKDGRNDKGVDTQTLTIRAQAPSSAAKGIPSGLLAYVTMLISRQGRAAAISLEPALQATELGSGRKLDKVQVTGATIDVLAEGDQPMVSCFFFTH